MNGFLLLAFFLLLGPMAILFGVDSRDYDERDQRPWWPGGETRGEDEVAPPLLVFHGAAPVLGRDEPGRTADRGRHAGTDTG